MSNRYDLLFSDLKGTQMYVDFIKKHAKGKHWLEFASGTGDLLYYLNQDYDVLGVDLDEEMIQFALEKYPELSGKLVQGNFLTYQNENRFDTLICVGDSLNYTDNSDELHQFVEVASTLSDHIIVDFHHPYRLEEFKDTYYEEGSTDAFDYAYQIEVYEDRLIHTINYLNGQMEQVFQWVFNPLELITLFENKGYHTEIFSDFEYEGITNEGEKIMCIFTKEEI